MAESKPTQHYPSTLEHINAVLLERDLRYKQKFDAIDERVLALDKLTDAKFVTHGTLLESESEKTAIALQAADKAISKFEAAIEQRFVEVDKKLVAYSESMAERFKSVNEFRGTLSDQARDFVTKIEHNTVKDAISERLEMLISRMDRNEGRSGGLHAGWLYLTSAVVLVGGIIAIIVRLNP